MRVIAAIASLATMAYLPIYQASAQGIDPSLETCPPLCRALFPGQDGLSLQARQDCIIDCLEGGTGGGQTPPPPPPKPGDICSRVKCVPVW